MERLPKQIFKNFKHLFNSSRLMSSEYGENVLIIFPRSRFLVHENSFIVCTTDFELFEHVS